MNQIGGNANLSLFGVGTTATFEKTCSERFRKAKQARNMKDKGSQERNGGTESEEEVEGVEGVQRCRGRAMQLQLGDFDYVSGQVTNWLSLEGKNKTTMSRLRALQ